MLIYLIVSVGVVSVSRCVCVYIYHVSIYIKQFSALTLYFFSDLALIPCFGIWHTSWSTRSVLFCVYRHLRDAGSLGCSLIIGSSIRVVLRIRL